MYDIIRVSVRSLGVCERYKCYSYFVLEFSFDVFETIHMLVYVHYLGAGVVHFIYFG